VLELKRPDLALSDDDRRQGLSYARLLEPMAPLTIVSNGEQTQVFQTYDGAEWKPESPDATALEQLIRNATRMGAQDIQNAIATLLGPESDKRPYPRRRAPIGPANSAAPAPARQSQRCTAQNGWPRTALPARPIASYSRPLHETSPPTSVKTLPRYARPKPCPV